MEMGLRNYDVTERKDQEQLMHKTMPHPEAYPDDFREGTPQA